MQRYCSLYKCLPYLQSNCIFNEVQSLLSTTQSLAKEVAKSMFWLPGHRKAVSYVAYMNDRELVSASTDSTLRLWNNEEKSSVRKFSGHVNEKNFVGLSCEQDFVACGSETSEVCNFKPSAPSQLWSSALQSNSFPATCIHSLPCKSYFV